MAYLLHTLQKWPFLFLNAARLHTESKDTNQTALPGLWKAMFQTKQKRLTDLADCDPTANKVIELCFSVAQNRQCPQ